MDFKYINDRNKTPNSNLTKKLSNTVSCDSPFRFLPDFSTPPSRFTRIVNPFEPHLIERLHLPMFSPSVFAKVSTPKTDEKFKWTIEDMSSLKPADIDEETVSQHVFEEDPHTELLVQQKIDTFFSEKLIVPSPATDVVRVPLVTETDTPKADTKPKQYSEASAQTVLTLPPVLMPDLEAMLKPYFTYNEDQQKPGGENIRDISLYRQLFDFQDETSSASNESSPAHSTGLSPIHLSPLATLERSLGPLGEMPELRDCALSPICRKSPRASRSACRLNFSSRMSMSVDASVGVVPDIANQMSTQSEFIDDFSPQPVEIMSNSTVNWDMEYKHVSLTSPDTSKGCEKMDMSSSNTPHSRIFPSQRKRLSDSFKDEEEEDNNKENEPLERPSRKLFRNDATDPGYHTGTGVGVCEETESFAGHVFASTPTKRLK
ncbi:hypothetical protein NQ315_011721 [Exocentrus adspersus]|uniref:Protein aurora borealis n=1 Tax=Exocentrus adspersus TaxID=1586481 RepID=A0AAV8W1E4_9CUCU|nr:hypothetical protein NQ315_011721 [Exocentrus adspersus]